MVTIDVAPGAPLTKRSAAAFCGHTGCFDMNGLIAISEPLAQRSNERAGPAARRPSCVPLEPRRTRPDRAHEGAPDEARLEPEPISDSYPPSTSNWGTPKEAWRILWAQCWALRSRARFVFCRSLNPDRARRTSRAPMSAGRRR